MKQENVKEADRREKLWKVSANNDDAGQVRREELREKQAGNKRRKKEGTLKTNPAYTGI